MAFIKSLAFLSTSALIEAITEVLFFAERIFYGSFGVAIISPFGVIPSGSGTDGIGTATIGTAGIHSSYVSTS